MKIIIGLTAAITLLVGPVAAAEFRVSFTWEGLKSCTTGRPNIVPNPRFKLSGVPAGTTAIQFKLKDLDVPSYNHGGGWIEISSDGTVPAKAFNYKSPCPPSGRHTYQWTALAKTKKGGKTLAKAQARRAYPE